MATFIVTVKDGENSMHMEYVADRLSLTGLSVMALEAVQKVESANMPDRLTVRLVSHGEKKIECIKELRGFFGWDLRDAKDASEKPNNDLLTSDDKAHVDRLVKILRGIGAIVEVIPA